MQEKRRNPSSHSLPHGMDAVFYLSLLLKLAAQSLLLSRLFLGHKLLVKVLQETCLFFSWLDSWFFFFFYEWASKSSCCISLSMNGVEPTFIPGSFWRNQDSSGGLSWARRGGRESCFRQQLQDSCPSVAWTALQPELIESEDYVMLFMKRERERSREREMKE